MSKSVAQIKCKRREDVFPKLCRTCLCVTTDRNLYTTDTTNKISLQTMLHAFTGLQMSPDDKLPQYVCVRCADDIQSAYSFHTRSHETDKILRLLQKQMHTIRIYTCPTKQSIGMKSTDTHDLKASDKKLSENPEDVSKRKAISARATKMRYKCRFCSKTFQMKPNFIKHLQKHTTKKKWKTYTKRKAYISQTELLRHLTTHTAVKDSCSPSTITKESVGDGDSSFHNLNQDYTQNIVEELQVGFKESIKEEKLDDVHSTSKIINEPLGNNQSELDILKEHPIRFFINMIEEIPEEDRSTYKANDELATDDEWWLFHEPTEYILPEKILEQNVTQSGITDDHLMCNNTWEAPLFDQSDQVSIKKKCENSTEDSNDNYITSSPIKQFKQDSKQQSSIELLDGLSVTIKEEKDDASPSDVHLSFHQYEHDYARHFTKEPLIEFDLSVKEENLDDVHLKFINEPVSNNQSSSLVNIKEENPDEEESSFDNFTKSNCADKTWEARKESDASHKYIIRKALSNNKTSLDKSAYRREGSAQMPSASFTCESGQREVEFKDYQDIASHYISMHCKGVPLNCPVCAKWFPTKVYFRRHLRLHLACVQSLSNKGLFKCPKCPKEFSKLWCPEIHIRRDDIWKKYNCNAASVRSVLQEPSVGSVDRDRCDLSHCDDEPSLNEPRQCPSKMIAPRVDIDFTDEEEISDDDDDSIINPEILLRYLCTVPNCKENFMDRSDLLKHYRNQHNMGSAPFKCLVCAKEIADNLQVLGHLRSHMVAKYKCPRCPKIYRYAENLKTHFHTHTFERTLKCLNCPKRFITQYALNVHSKTHGKEYECKLCKKEFDSKNGFHFHMKSHQESKELQCNTGGKQFPIKSHLQRHLDSACCNRKSAHLKVAVNASKETNCFKDRRDEAPKVFYIKPVSSQTISKESRLKFSKTAINPFNDNEQVFDRSKQDSGQKSFEEQPTCLDTTIDIVKNEPFSDNEPSLDLPTQESSTKVKQEFSPVDVDLTVMTETSDDGNDDDCKSKKVTEFPCDVPQCGEKFTQRLDILAHYITHHNMSSPPLNCPVCTHFIEKKTEVFKHLHLHIRRTHKCPHCPKKCISRSNLQKHIQTHGTEVFKCRKCPVIFRSRIATITHYTQKHNMESTPLECPVCAKVFTDNDKMLVHLKSHVVGEFLCPYCPKLCPTLTSLLLHKKTHPKPRV